MFDRCVCCGTAVSEGRQVCPNCERRMPMDLAYDKENNVWKEVYKLEIFFDSEEQRDRFEQALNSGGLEPARPRGCWKGGRCSNCGTQAEVQSIGFNCTGGTRIDYKHTNFCPSCGAVMKSEESK